METNLAVRAERYRAEAELARIEAAAMQHAELKQQLLDIAERYESLAETVEKVLAALPTPEFSVLAHS